MTHLHPDPTAVAAFSGLGLTLAALALGAVVRRRAVAGRAETVRRIDSLAARVAALEARTVEKAAPPSRVVAASSPSPVRRADRPATVTQAGPTLIKVPNMAAGPSSRDGARSELGRRYAAIWERADAGEPAEAIARSTGQPIGQVELILGLKRRRSVRVKGRPS